MGDQSLQRRDDAQAAIANPLFALLKKRRKQIEAIIPDFLTPERVLNLVNTAILKTPDLVQCSPHSVVNAIMHASMLGLEIAQEQAYLVPFRVKGKMQATLMIDYRAKRDLVVAGGLVKNIHPYVVYSHDEFAMELAPSLGLMQVTYKPFLARKTEAGMQPIEEESQRGVPLGVLCIAPFTSGGADVLWMPKIDIIKIKARSRASGDGPWVTDEMEMWKKTAVHRHVKSLPKPKGGPAWKPGEALPAAERIQRSQEIDDRFELAEPLEDVIDADFEDEQPMISQGTHEQQEAVAAQKIETLIETAKASPDEGMRGTAERYEQQAEAQRGKMVAEAKTAEAKAETSPKFSFGRKS